MSYGLMVLAFNVVCRTELCSVIVKSSFDRYISFSACLDPSIPLLHSQCSLTSHEDLLCPHPGEQKHWLEESVLPLHLAHWVSIFYPVGFFSFINLPILLPFFGGWEMLTVLRAYSWNCVQMLSLVMVGESYVVLVDGTGVVGKVLATLLSF